MPTQRDRLERGVVIGGRYTVVDHLASGGMADVYVAVQAPLERRVAVKVLRPDRGASEASQQRFQQEALALSRLTHPNTITIFDFGTFRDCFYLVMELIDGEPLSERLKRSGPLPVEDAVDIASQVARSLHEAHGLGIVHRDLKPANIYLGRVEHNLVKVLDFGIATGLEDEVVDKKTDRITQDGMVPGTPEYMSPEHAQGEVLDGRSDLYSLAVVLWEMLTGDVVYCGENALATVMMHVHDPIPHLPRRFSPSLDAFMTRALAKSPAQRPDDAQAFSDELNAALEAEDSPAHERRSVTGIPAIKRAPTAPSPSPPSGGDWSDSRESGAQPTRRLGPDSRPGRSAAPSAAPASPGRRPPGRPGRGPASAPGRGVSPPGSPRSTPRGAPRRPPAPGTSGPRGSASSPRTPSANVGGRAGSSTPRREVHTSRATTQTYQRPGTPGLGAVGTAASAGSDDPRGTGHEQVFARFARSVLARLGDRPRAPALKRNLDFAASAWNAVVDGEAALTNARSFLARQGTADMRRAFEELVAVKRDEFSDHRWRIEDIAVDGDGPGAPTWTLEVD